MLDRRRRVGRGIACFVARARFLAIIVGIMISTPASSNDVIRAAVPANFPPHYLIGENGIPEGFAIDILETMADEAGMDVEYQIHPTWTEVEAAFKAGEVDVIPNLGITKARQEWADFTRSLETFPIVVIVRSGSNLVGLEALKGKSVAAVRFNVGARILSQHTEINTILFESSREALLALLTGEVEAWVYPESVAWRLARQAGLQDRIKVAGDPIREILRGIAIQKNRADIRDRLDKVAATFVYSQVYQDIYAKWHGHPEPFWTPLRIGWTAAGATLLLLLTGWIFLTITLRRRVSRRTLELRLLHKTAVEANEATSVDDLLQRSLEAICHEMRYPVGHAYVLDPGADAVLVSSRIWHLDDPDGFAVFRELSEKATFSAGEGLPGRVLAKRQPVWIEDVQKDPNFPRAQMARDIGVHAGVAFPVMVAGSVQAVLEFFGRDPERPDPLFFQSLTQVGSGLGRVMEKMAIQEKLRESQERFDLAVQGSGDAMWEYNSRTEENWFSPRFVELLGYRPDELPHTLDTWKNHLHPDDRDHAYAAFSDHLKDDVPYDIEYRLRLKNGEHRWFRARAKTLRDANNQANRTSGTVSDITERKAAEEKSKASERRLAKAQEIATLGNWDWNINTGKITWSAQIYRIFGLDPNRDQPTYDAFLAAIHPDDRETVVQAVNASIADRTIPYKIEHRILRPDGTERFVSEIGEVLRDAEDKPVHMTGVVQDITERKMAEKALKDSEARFQTVLDNMPIAVFMRDLRGRYTLINEAYRRFFGISVEEIDGKEMPDLLPPEQARVFKEQDREVIGQGTVIEFESKIEGETGTRTLATIKFPIRDVQGDLVAVGGVDVDITERREAEQRIKESEERLRFSLSSMGAYYWVDDLVTGTVEYDSPNFYTQYGYDQAEIPRTIEEYVALIHPHDIPAAMAAFQAHVDGNAPLHQAEFRFRRKDGSWAWTLNFGRVIEKDEAGKVVKVAGLTLDITERKDAEHALADAYGIISSSIDYASSIQRSLLPRDAYLAEDLAEHFIMWEPRDVVGGDLYWYRRCERCFLIVLADCTGHGVPGAFLTMLTTGALDRALRDKPEGDPAEILSLMNRSIKYSLGQDDAKGESDDGVELGICRIRDESNSLEFAGARFSLFQLTGSGAREVKGDRSGIGYRDVPDGQAFTNHEITYSKADTFYMTTDGLTDQIGGPKGRSFGMRRTVELLKSIHDLPLVEQKGRIVDALRDYQGHESRRDDITMIGFKPKDPSANQGS